MDMEMRTYGIVGLVVGLLLVPGAVAENATLADLDATESRLTAAMESHHDSLGEDIAQSNTDIQALLADAQALLDALSVRVGLLQADMTALRNETLEDHVQIYQVIKELREEVDAMALASQEVTESQEALVTTQTRMRSDLDNLNGDVVTGFNNMNTANEQIFSAAEAGRATLTNFLLVVVIAMLSIHFSYLLQRPRKLWRWVAQQRAIVNTPGGLAEPECPQTDEGLTLGDFYQCPYNAACPSGEACKAVAIRKTQEVAFAEEEEEEEAPNGHAGENGQAGKAEDPIAFFGGR